MRLIRPRTTPVFRIPRTATAALSALLCLTLLASCASAVGERRAAADGTASEGGVVRIGTLTDFRPKTLYAGATTTEQTVSGLVYDTLTGYGNESLDPVPRLAESWETSQGGRTVTLRLRPGVRFHDGSALTSADVRASLANYSDPSHSGQLARTAALVSDVDTTDPNTAVLHLSRQVNNLFDLLSIVPVIDDRDVDGFNAGTSFNGTGAFRFSDWRHGTRITFDANPDYWGGAPILDGAELITVPDNRTLFSQLRSGQLDLVADAEPRDAAALEDNDLFTVLDRTGVDPNEYAGLNTASPALSDRRVRQAIAWAIDRERILDEVFRGRGRVSALPWPTYSPANPEPGDPGPGTDAYRLDTDRARQLLAEVTDDPGTWPEIPLSYAAGSQAEQNIAQIISANLADIGLRTRLDPQESAVMVDRLRSGTFEGIWILGHSFAQYTPSTLPVSAFPFNSENNASNLVDQRYTQDATDAWTVPDPAGEEAEDVYGRLNADLIDNAFVLELVAPDAPLITSSALHDLAWSKRSEPDLSRAYFTD